MKISNRELMLRAVGILEGLFYTTSEEGRRTALESVLNLLDCVLRGEPPESEDTK